jgi:hypothetical protein
VSPIEDQAADPTGSVVVHCPHHVAHDRVVRADAQRPAVSLEHRQQDVAGALGKTNLRW